MKLTFTTELNRR